MSIDPFGFIGTVSSNVAKKYPKVTSYIMNNAHLPNNAEIQAHMTVARVSEQLVKDVFWGPRNFVIMEDTVHDEKGMFLDPNIILINDDLLDDIERGIYGPEVLHWIVNHEVVHFLIYLQYGLTDEYLPGATMDEGDHWETLVYGHTMNNYQDIKRHYEGGCP